MVLNNKQWLDHIKESIGLKPSIVPAIKLQEQSFLESFYDTEGNPVRDIHHLMSGVKEEEDHFKNLFFNVFYNRVVRLGIVETLSIPNHFEVFMRGNLDRGAAWSRTMTDIMEDEDYSRTGSPFETNFENTVGKTVEVFSDLVERKLIPFTIPAIQGLNEAFLNSDYGIDQLVGQFFTNANKTIEYRVDRTMRDLLKLSSTEGNVQAPFVDIIINKTDEDYKIALGSVIDGTATLNDFGEGSVETGLRLSGLINSIIDGMSEPSRKYNKGNSDGKFLTSLRKGSAVGFINSNALRSMEIRNDSFFGDTSQIYKSFDVIEAVSDLGKITKVERTVNNEGQITDVVETVDENKTVLAVIGSRDMFEFKFNLQAATDIMNPRTLDHNHFRHYWYSTLSNPFVPAVRIILDTSEV